MLLVPAPPSAAVLQYLSSTICYFSDTQIDTDTRYTQIQLPRTQIQTRYTDTQILTDTTSYNRSNQIPATTVTTDTTILIQLLPTATTDTWYKILIQICYYDLTTTIDWYWYNKGYNWYQTEPSLDRSAVVDLDTATAFSYRYSPDHPFFLVMGPASNQPSSSSSVPSRPKFAWDLRSPPMARCPW